MLMLLRMPGMRCSMRRICQAITACGTSVHVRCRVFVNAMLSGVQQRNLEAAWGCPVLDRVGLIIGIFAQRARTREARLQVLCLFWHCSTSYSLIMLLGVLACMPREGFMLSNCQVALGVIVWPLGRAPGQQSACFGRWRWRR
jgi:hypothetical protein